MAAVETELNRDDALRQRATRARKEGERGVLREEEKEAKCSYPARSGGVGSQGSHRGAGRSKIQI